MYISRPVRSIASIYRDRESADERSLIRRHKCFFFVPFPEDLYFTSHVATRLTRVEKKICGKATGTSTISSDSCKFFGICIDIACVCTHTLRGFTFPRTNEKKYFDKREKERELYFYEKKCCDLHALYSKYISCIIFASRETYILPIATKLCDRLATSICDIRKN